MNFNKNSEFMPKLRTSMESDTSGYSSSSQKTESTTTTNNIFTSLIKIVKSTSSSFGAYNDEVVSLKECETSDTGSKKRLAHLHVNEDTNEHSSTAKRRKSIILQRVDYIEKEKCFKNDKKESNKNDDHTAQNDHDLPQRPISRRKSGLFEFPKTQPIDFVIELKSSSPVKSVNRRKSCVEIQREASSNYKIITRRRSVFINKNAITHDDDETAVPSSSSSNKIRARRRSSYIDKSVPLRRSRRKSICVEKFQEFKKTLDMKPKDAKKYVQKSKLLKTAEVIETFHSQELEIKEEIIEDVWFVSLETIENKSQMKFLIKWEGFPISENTYEPFEHIRHCEVLQEYVDRKFVHFHDQIEQVREKLLSDIQDNYDNYLRKSKPSIVKKFVNFDVLEFKCSILAFIFTYGGKVMESFMKKLRSQNLIYHFYAQWRREQESNFMLLETIMSEEDYSFKLTAENNIDYEPIPKFEYLSKVIYPLNTFAMGLNVGCKCGKRCNKKSQCCPQSLNWNFLYNESDLKLNTRDVQMIVECNEFCSCDANCPNKPKQITARLSLFKTQDRGWGIKTLNPIAAGRFIIEYTGEFLDKNENRRRAKVYSNAEATYLFDLDYIEKGKTPFSIDATHKGNLARFINHSCNPNLHTWPATTCNQDPRMHKLYYFSQRYIRAGEELTVDYTGGRKNMSIKSLEGEREKFVCHCGSSLCRGFIF